MKLTQLQLDELNELLTALCEDSINQQQFEKLDELVCQSDEARKLYVEYLDAHADLYSIYCEQTFPQDGKNKDQQSWVSLAEDESDPKTRNPIVGFLVSCLNSTGQYMASPAGISVSMAALTLSVMLLILAYINPFDDQADPSDPNPVLAPYVARITQAVDCKWKDSTVAPAVGEQLREGRVLQIETGIITIHFDDGTRVNLSGPAKFRLTSVNNGLLHSGKLVAKVPPGAEGFSIDTDVLTIVDLGTEFAVEARKSGVTDVVCFKGSVELLTGQGKPPITLKAGKSLRITSQGAAVDSPLQNFKHFPRVVTSQPDRELINIDFNRAKENLTFKGAAAFSSGGNYWNGINSNAAKSASSLQTASQKLTNVAIKIIGKPSWTRTEHSAIKHDLINDYIVVQDAQAKFMISGLIPEQNYDIYLYGTSGQGKGPQTQVGVGASEGTIFTIDRIKKTTTGLRVGDKPFTEGKDYVIYRKIMANDDGKIYGRWTNNPKSNSPVNTNPYGPLNGLQIIGKF